MAFGLTKLTRGAVSAAGLPMPGVSSDKKTVSGSGVKKNSTVSVFKNGTQAGTTTADSSGNWSYAFGAALSPGDKVSYDAVQTSPAFTIPVPPTLSALALSGNSAVAGTTFSAAISGRVSGSTITATSSDGSPLTVSGSMITGTFASAGNPSITLIETLANAIGSPKTTVLPITVSSSSSQTPAPSGASLDFSDPANSGYHAAL